jgi:hypothetical protein
MAHTILSIPAGGPNRRSAFRRHHMMGYANGWRDALLAAAQLVCPEPHVEEERNCMFVAAELRSLALTPWPEYPEFGFKEEEDDW